MKSLTPLVSGKSLSLGYSPTFIAGLGWSPSSAWREREIDLDAGAIMVTGSPFNPNSLRATSGHMRQCASYFAQLNLPGLNHSGDDLTGSGADYDPDEVIRVTPDQLFGNADGVLFYVNIHQGVQYDVELDEVKNVFWTLRGGSVDIVRNVNREFKDKRSAILGGIFRDGQGGWSAHHLSMSSEQEIAGLLNQRLGVSQFH